MSRSVTYERRWLTLAVLCLSLFVITVDGTIVNIALPSFVRELGADTTQLQWIVDAYTLVFAGLLLLAGALGDRFGRDRALAGGLAVFGVGSLLAMLASTPDQLIATRALMGVGAAFVMPATLSILSAVFEDPIERAKAIAAWTAVSGLGVAIGPTAGGWLLEHYAWSSIFVVNVPVIVIALIAGRMLVPASAAGREGDRRRLDLGGAVLSVAALSVLTWTLIEAPHQGWTSQGTLAAAGVAAALLGTFVAWELRVPEPLMELSLFHNARFTAACASVTIVFFALFGCLFLLTQILQFVLAYSPLKAGMAALPFALVIAVTSPSAAAIAKRVGTKIPVAAGLIIMAGGFATMATASADSGYTLYLLASVLIAGGMGLTMAPATESIMGALPAAKAGVGSAMNDTTREVGSVLGIAIIGSAVASGYTARLADATAGLPSAARDISQESLGAAIAVAQRVGGAEGHHLARAAQEAFISAAGRGLLIAAGVALVGAIVAWRALPARETDTAIGPQQPAREIDHSEAAIASAKAPHNLGSVSSVMPPRRARQCPAATVERADGARADRRRSSEPDRLSS